MQGGGVYSVTDIPKSTVKMSGGTIICCTAQYAGGGVSSNSYEQPFKMIGGEISGCISKVIGGGIYNTGAIEVGKSAKITGNIILKGSSPNNLYLYNSPKSKTVKIATGEDAPDENMLIGVTLGTPDGTGAVTDTCSSDYASRFTSDDSTKCVYNDNNIVKLKRATAIVINGNGYDSVQKAINAATSEQTIKMLSDATENVTVYSDDNITLDLNGHVLKGTGSDHVITNKGKLTITDDNSYAPHKYVVGADGLWTWNDGAEGTETNFENLKVRPSQNDVILVRGGAITGGNSAYGGGIYNNGTLTIKSGNVIGNNANNGDGGAVHNDSSATFLMTGGRFIGNITTCYGTVNTCDSFIMENGDISFNKVNMSGGAVYVYSNKTFTMKGGTLSFNIANYSGGAVDCEKGSFHMYGGIITGNEAGNGGGVSNGNSPTSFHMHGGAIKGNHASTKGGGLFTEKSDCTFDGKCIVTGNTAGTDRHTENVYLDSGQTVQISNGGSTETYTGKGTLLSESEIGVTLSSGTGAFTTNGTANDVQYFTSDDARYEVKFNNNNTAGVTTDDYLELTVLPAHIHDQGKATEIKFDQIITTEAELKALFTNGGKGYLVKDIQLSNVLNEDYGKTVDLCLNGKTLDLNNQVIVTGEEGVFNLYDCKELGKVINGGGNSNKGGAVYVGQNSTFNMYGGIIADSGVADGGGAIFTNAGTINMFGGKITNCTATHGGAVDCSSGTFHMYGGEITGNKANDDKTYTYGKGLGGAVFNGESGASFHMHGGSITGNYAETNGGGLYAQSSDCTFDGKCIVIGNTAGVDKHTENVYLDKYSGGYQCTVGINNGCSTMNYDGKGALLSGSEIGVTTKTVPTNDSQVAVTGDNNNDYSQYFDSDNTSYEIYNDINGGVSAQVVMLRIKHVHSWTYVEGGTDKENTLLAYCTAANCDGTAISIDVAQTLMIEAPTSLIYDGTAKAATIKDSKTSLGGIETLPDIQYQKKTGESTYDTATTNVPTDAGTYKASITVDTDKTAYVEYTIAKKELTVNGTTVANKTYDGTTAASVTAGALQGVVNGDKVSIDTATGVFADEKVGTGKKVTVSYTLTGADAGNYTVRDDEINADITEVSQPSYAPSVGTYTITVANAVNGAVTSSAKTAASGSMVTLTVKPDKGYTLETLTAKDSKGKDVILTAVKIGDTYTFKMPAANVTVTATFMEDNTMLNFFVDVKASDYFYEPVLWAVKNGITSGVDSLHFAPEDITTRAQMVTFLWRAAGCPEPQSSSTVFTDISASKYYYKAVLWAYENVYVKGTSATTFSPEDTVTRGQCVAILARMNGVKDEDTGYTHPFTDVKPTKYYNNAIAWASTNGITSGITPTTFAPENNCLRGEIVTFIYRSMVK